jgi:hypothetical protein
VRAREAREKQQPTGNGNGAAAAAATRKNVFDYTLDQQRDDVRQGSLFRYFILIHQQMPAQLQEKTQQFSGLTLHLGCVQQKRLFPLYMPFLHAARRHQLCRGGLLRHRTRRTHNCRNDTAMAAFAWACLCIIILYIYPTPMASVPRDVLSQVSSALSSSSGVSADLINWLHASLFLLCLCLLHAAWRHQLCEACLLRHRTHHITLSQTAVSAVGRITML